MKRNHRTGTIGLTAAAILLASAGAYAATIPTNVLVDEKDFKKNAPAGTMITFELHQDSGCTAAIDTDTIDADVIDVTERLKQRNVKSGTKRTNVLELHHTFTGVTPATGDLFVKVTGTGIDTTAYGDCQAQEPATAAFTTGGSCVRVPSLIAPPVAVTGTVPLGTLLDVACCPSGLTAVSAAFSSGITGLGCDASVIHSAPAFGAFATGFAAGFCPGDGWEMEYRESGACGGAEIGAFDLLCCP